MYFYLLLSVISIYHSLLHQILTFLHINFFTVLSVVDLGGDRNDRRSPWEKFSVFVSKDERKMSSAIVWSYPSVQLITTTNQSKVRYLCIASNALIKTKNFNRLSIMSKLFHTKNYLEGLVNALRKRSMTW